MGTNYVTSVANSAVNSFYIGENGLAFNTDGFTKSLYSADTISGALGAGITAGLNATTIGYNNQYVNGFNSQQIRNIKIFNSLMGGLTTNTSSLLMGGNANLNLLSYKGVGMLEFSFGKDGIKSKIGMGGTNISIQNLVGAFGGATNLHKNSQINNIGYDKTTLDALRSQWGFGDDVAKKQLEEIIKRDTILKLDADGSEVAKSINENGQKIIHLNSSQNQGFIDLGLTLQHEAYRDGIVSDAQSQFIETANAVAGHTKMALAMTKDKLYTKDMLNHISSDTNLQNDINAYMYAAYTGNTGLFAGYVNAAYDSSADYWKLMDDGSLAYDGKANLYDENGNLIYKTEKTGLEGSLVEILYGKNATAEQIDEVRNLMDKNFSHYTLGDDANNKDNWYWNGKVTEENMGKQISGLTVFGKYGDSIVSQAYAHHFDSTVDAIYAAANGIDIGTVDMKATAFFSMDRFRELYKEKSLFYESAGALFESEDTEISGVYGDYLRNKDGSLLKNYKLSDGSVVDYTYFYKSYKNLHYGIDLIKKSGSDNILLGLSGMVDTNGWNDAEGFTLQMNYGYNFEGSFISTGIFGEYGHLKEQSPLQNETFYSSTQTAGLFGNTGNKSTGAHLHYSVYTKDNIAYSDTSMKILFGKNYQVGSMYNGSWRTVYNPTSFYERYR